VYGSLEVCIANVRWRVTRSTPSNRPNRAHV
jgi:hypothetical protein